jgi:hypothetical protein
MVQVADVAPCIFAIIWIDFPGMTLGKTLIVMLMAWMVTVAGGPEVVGILPPLASVAVGILIASWPEPVAVGLMVAVNVAMGPAGIRVEFCPVTIHADALQVRDLPSAASTGETAPFDTARNAGMENVH